MNHEQKAEFRTFRGYQLISQKEGQLTPAMEDYLEMIFRLCSKDGYTRVGRLSELLHVKPSSASKMMMKLAEMGYLKYDRYEIILLTEAGLNAGEYLLERHNTVEQFLLLAGSSDSLEETELIEHSLSEKTVACLKTMLEFFQSDPESRKRFTEFKSRL
ncbi:Transcriptional regulator MntR [Caprobacter fermentans]|uniref:Manganese transport regulator n=1 Tax=Caproicibacter fermentans TaxID=2576756 RepID=A0A6N8HWK9_9FIRM|nr:iron dependent repressor, metal binding and dimerization domain protein [Caproicibacter fermentans]MVB09940.1 Transcriptional regulator MntR [Caproicibacter fermentans]OCN00358.1 DtxR family transcriptional regulator [Clostridium sp. W14A]QNK42557.1 DtxR family transcriptional regulator [Caproicibacter fermentans]